MDDVWVEERDVKINTVFISWIVLEVVSLREGNILNCRYISINETQGVALELETWCL